MTTTVRVHYMQMVNAANAMAARGEITTTTTTTSQSPSF